MFICLRPPPLLDFGLGRSSNFVGSESGQIQNVTLLQNMLQNMVSNTNLNTSPPLGHTLTVCMYYTLTQGGGGGGGGELGRRLEGQQFTQQGRKYQHD